MRDFLKNRQVEFRLFIVLVAVCVALSLTTDTFLTLGNLTSLLNNNSVNLIWAVGLLVVLIAGGIDISFAVASSVVQFIAAKLLIGMGGGNWIFGFLICGSLGVCLGLVNAALIHGFRIISIIVTIATFNAFFGLLMFLSGGRSIYALPDWWVDRVAIFRHAVEGGPASELTLPVAVMVVCVGSTWFLIRRMNLGRQLYAFGDNPEGARRAGVNLAVMQGLAFGWCGLMAGIAALMQVNIVQEVVPNALYGRELEVLSAVVLGGARLGGGKGTVSGCILGVMFVAVTQNGLNLLGISPFAFQMIIGDIPGVAVSTANINFSTVFASAQGGKK